jgi:hypothetical protein
MGRLVICSVRLNMQKQQMRPETRKRLTWRLYLGTPNYNVLNNATIWRRQV